MLDPIDTRLIHLLQRQGDATAAQLGEVLNLSTSQAARRRTRLEDEGVIAGYTVRLNPQALGLAVQAFLQVRLAPGQTQARAAFLELIADLASVTGCWALAGEAHFLLRVWCADLKTLDELIHQTLLPHPSVASLTAQVVTDQAKPDTGLPV